MTLAIVLDLVAVFTTPIPTVPSAVVSTSMIASMARGGAIFSAVISAVFVFLYWKGFDWMRWVVMVYSGLVILGAIIAAVTGKLTHLTGAVSVGKAILAIYLFWYLNTPPVRAWFSSPKTEVPVI